MSEASDTPQAAAWRPLRGQKALVTGANSGIGRAIAVALAAAGADVGVNYVTRPDDAAAVVTEIEGVGAEGAALLADVSREDQVVAMFDAFRQRFGRIDILVSNAGVQRDAQLVDMTLADWSTVIGINLTGQFLCCREAVRAMTKQGIVPGVSKSAGKIVCMSSVHQKIPWAGHVNYAASKGGIEMMMQSIAQEVAPLHIRVNAIAPGAIRTPINRPAWSTPEALRALNLLIPYGRIGEPEDIARTAVWIASDEADYVTGTTFFVDGGMTLFPGFAHGG
ncbi:MAG TPA: SDR family oxidoreductase [Stellaceae bacterium]|nr:SDR family oxidoreductase [Stellaceae bacterium]